MRHRFTLIAAATTLALTACGGSSSDQDEVADLLIETASEEGLELDEGCVRDTASQLSDADAAALVEAGVDGEADVSDEANALADEILGCVDVSSYRDALIDAISEGDDSIDADCLRDALGDLSSAEEIDDAIFGAAFDCSSG